MKRLTFFLILLMSVQLLNAQELYYIMKTKGQIKVKGTSVLLKPGMKILANQKVIFRDKGAVASVMSRDKGRFLMRPKESSSSNALLEFAVSETIGDASRKQTSTRGALLNSSIEMKKYFERDTLLVLGDDLWVKISPKAYPMNEKTFFYIAYNHSDFPDEAINKKLDFKADTLIFDRNTIFKVDDKSIDGLKASNFKLYYYNTEAASSDFISSFLPVFIDDNQLKEEVKVMVDIMKEAGVSDEKIYKETRFFVAEFYGHPDKDDFDDWMKDNFGIVVK